MKIKIQEIPVAFTVSANYIQLRQGAYILGSNEGCKVRVLFFKGENLVNDQQIVEIPANIVANWVDDTEMIDYVINELNLIKVTEEDEIGY